MASGVSRIIGKIGVSDWWNFYEIIWETPQLGDTEVKNYKGNIGVGRGEGGPERGEGAKKVHLIPELGKTI